MPTTCDDGSPSSSEAQALSINNQKALCEDGNNQKALCEDAICDDNYILKQPGLSCDLHICPSLTSKLSGHDLHLLRSVRHHDPFSVLGCHRAEDETGIVIRVWRKDAKKVQLRFCRETGIVVQGNSSIAAEWTEMEKTNDWLHELEFVLPSSMTYEDFCANYDPVYEIRVKYDDDESKEEDWHLTSDPYTFPPSVSNFDLQNFQSGHCWHVDSVMGSHIVTMKGVAGVRFSVWAPTAKFVSVVGDWNQWDGRAHPMRRHDLFGVWDLFIPSIGPGEKYSYKIHTAIGTDIVKIDPYAQEFENPPKYSSVISSCDDAFKSPEDRFQWTDDAWVAERTKMGVDSGIENISRQPMSIYEVHLPSWRRGDGNSYLSYRELADPLIAHVKAMNFTHVEFLPVTHHPFEGSWGYQVSGNYAVYSRLGNGDDLKFLINKLHEAGIGVFLDIVPAHFCKDDWGLARYDGSPTYEYSDPREGENKGWGTYVYNFGRNEVRSYLLGAIYHWIRRYHIDGIRIDAVSAMIYKDYCREDGAWVSNEMGGNANLQAIAMIREMNWVVHKNHPGVFMMAEESTSWKGVTDRETGLGFDAKWDLGWMNDTLSYTTCPADLRPSKHDKLTFRGLYVGHESWVCPLSHDEVVSGKGSLLDKMGSKGAPFAERIATHKAIIGFQIGVPGRPLLFQGAEFAQGREWSEKRSVDWHESEEELRKQVMKWVSDTLRIYKTHKALHAGDAETWNFKWVVADASEKNLVAFLRSFGEWHNDVLIICNLGVQKFWKHPFGVPHGGNWTCIANSDDWAYGGSMFGLGNGEQLHTTQGGVLGWPYCLWPDIAPNSCQIWTAPKPKGTQTPRQVISA